MVCPCFISWNSGKDAKNKTLAANSPLDWKLMWTINDENVRDQTVSKRGQYNLKLLKYFSSIKMVIFESQQQMVQASFL